MSQIDYTCYTVPECSSDEDDVMIRTSRRGSGQSGHGRDDSSDGTLENVLHSDGTLEDSDATTTTSSLEHHVYRQQQRQRLRSQRYGPQRISLPTLRAGSGGSAATSSHSRELTPQLGVYHDGTEAAEPQWGYFLPLAPNCFFSPPMHRRRFRCAKVHQQTDWNT